MKKMIKAFAAFAALALLGAGFVSCSDDDDDNKTPTVTATESTVKGTYTMTGGDLAAGESETLVAVDGKIYLKMDVFADDDEEEDSSGSVTYDLAYVSDSTTHEPTFTFADLDDESSDLYTTIVEKLTAGETSYIIYLEVGTYTIASGKVTGTLIDGEDDSATATTDSATGHLKTFTVNFGGSGNESKTYDFAGLQFSDFPENSLCTYNKTSKTETVVTEIGSNESLYVVGKTEWTIAGATLKCGTSNYQFRFTDGVSTSFNATSVGATAVPDSYDSTADRYIYVPVSAAGKIKVYYAITPSTAEGKIGATDAGIGLFGGDGSLLKKAEIDTSWTKVSALGKDSDAYKVYYGVKSSADTCLTIEADVTATTGKVYVGFWRGATIANGESGSVGTGGMDICKIEYTPAAD